MFTVLLRGHFTISKHEWSHQLRKVEGLSEGTESKHAVDELKLVKVIKPQKEAAIGHNLRVSWATLCVWLKNVSETPTLHDVLVWLPSYFWFLVYRGSGKVPGCKVLRAGLDRTHHIPTVLQPRDVTLAMPELQPNHSSFKVTHKNSHAFFFSLVHLSGILIDVCCESLLSLSAFWWLTITQQIEWVA